MILKYSKALNPCIIRSFSTLREANNGSLCNRVKRINHVAGVNENGMLMSKFSSSFSKGNENNTNIKLDGAEAKKTSKPQGEASGQKKANIIKNEIDKLKCNKEKLDYILKNILTSEHNIQIKKEKDNTNLYLNNIPVIKHLTLEDIATQLSSIEHRAKLLDIDIDIDMETDSDVHRQLSQLLNIINVKKYNLEDIVSHKLNAVNRCDGIGGYDVPKIFLNDSEKVIEEFSNYLKSPQSVNGDEYLANVCFDNYPDIKIKVSMKHLKSNPRLNNAPSPNFCVAQKVIVMTDNLDLTDVFNKIKQVNKPVAIIARTRSSNIFSISYHPKLGFYGEGLHDLKCFYRPEQLNDFVKSCISTFDEEAIVLEFLVATDNKTSVGEFIKTDTLNRFKNNSSLEQKKACMSLAISHGDSEILKAFIDDILKNFKRRKFTRDELKLLLEGKNSNGDSRLYMASKNGHADTVKIMADANYTQNPAIRILNTPRLSFYCNSGRGLRTSGVDAKNSFEGLLEACTKTMKVMTDLVKQSDISTKVELLSFLEAQLKNGISRKYITSKSGNTELVKVMTDFLIKIAKDYLLAEAQLKNGRSGQDIASKSGQDIASKLGNTDIVKVMTDTFFKLTNKNIPQDEILSFVEAQLKKGSSGQDIASKSVNTDIVRVIKDVIAELNKK